MNPSFMPAKINGAEEKPVYDKPRERCQRKGCERKVRTHTPDPYKYCSHMCVAMAHLMSDIKKLCARTQNEDASTLMADAVALSDALTDVMERRGKLARENPL